MDKSQVINMKIAASISVFVVGLAGAFSLGFFKTMPEDSSPVICVYTEDIGMIQSPESRLVFAAWDDGTVMWSENQNVGGGKIRKGNVPKSLIGDAINKLKRDGFFSANRLKKEYASPDSTVMSIQIRHKKEILQMKSVHELAELSGKEVAASDAIFGLKNETRLSVLSKEPADFLLFRLAWTEIRCMTYSLITRCANSEVVQDSVSVDSVLGR